MSINEPRSDDLSEVERTLEEDPHYMNNFWMCLMQRQMLESEKSDHIELAEAGDREPWSDRDEENHQKGLKFCDVVDGLVTEFGIDREFILSVMYHGHPKYAEYHAEKLLEAQAKLRPLFLRLVEMGYDPTELIR